MIKVSKVLRVTHQKDQKDLRVTHQKDRRVHKVTHLLDRKGQVVDKGQEEIQDQQGHRHKVE